MMKALARQIDITEREGYYDELCERHYKIDGVLDLVALRPSRYDESRKNHERVDDLLSKYPVIRNFIKALKETGVSGSDVYRALLKIDMK